MRLADIPPYTPTEWARERAADKPAAAIPCPNCGHAEWYHPLEVELDDGAWRQYRCCKMCGCWQEADGRSPAYRCALTVHTCDRALTESTQCANCEVWGPLGQHRCKRVLTPQEIGNFACKNCGSVITTAHVVPWPVAAD